MLALPQILSGPLPWLAALFLLLKVIVEVIGRLLIHRWALRDVTPDQRAPILEALREGRPSRSSRKRKPKAIDSG